MRAFALARCGQLGERLFEYPQDFGSEGLLIDRSDSLRTMFHVDSVYYYLGAYPSAQTPTTMKFLQYLDLSERQRKPMAKDYYLAKFDPNSTLDADQICREMNDEEWDYVESNAGSVCCKIGMRRRRERIQGQTADKWSETIFEATKARLEARWLKKLAAMKANPVGEARQGA